jgi:hypothetical protein
MDVSRRRRGWDFHDTGIAQDEISETLGPPALHRALLQFSTQGAPTGSV